jgi:MFS family permease
MVDVESKYFTHWLPGALLIGVGVALSFPVLSAAAVAGLPQERFGIGGAINQTARQIGAVLGVAVLIAILGTPSSLDQALHRFRVAWLVGTVAAVGSAAISSFHRRPVEVAAAVRVAPVPLDA